MTDNSTDYGEFLANPSEASKPLVNIVRKLNEQHQARLKTKNPFKKIKAAFTLSLYTKDSYKDFLTFLQEYTLPKYATEEEWYVEFEKVYDKLMLNNFALAYAFQQEKDVSNPILTKEDEKMNALRKFYNKEMTRQEFNEQWGHYALNAYEIESKRFEEYTEHELMKIAKLATRVSVKKKISYEEYTEKRKVPVLLYLRELAKYKILLIIKELRKLTT